MAAKWRRSPGQLAASWLQIGCAPIKVRPIPHRPGKYELSLTTADFETDPARKSPKHVLEQLVAAAAGGEGVSQKATPVELQGSGNQRATLSFGKKSVSVKITNLSPIKHAVLKQAIRTLIVDGARRSVRKGV